MAHDAPRHVGFLGPAGTFTEEALFTQRDYATAKLTPYATMTDVLDAVQRGQEDLGFVPIENA
ncbi:MAG: prephenate dehydratase domain-containing protein, partial [Acidimicrobiales bacterium]